MSYNNIFNPLTNKFVDVNTSEGLNVLKNYVSYVQNGGSKKSKISTAKKATTAAKNKKEIEKLKKIVEAHSAEAKKQLAQAEKIKEKIYKQHQQITDIFKKIEQRQQPSAPPHQSEVAFRNNDDEESDPDQKRLREEGAYDKGGYLNNGSTEENSDS